MPSLTSWSRLAGRSRRTDMRPGLEASIHDPLWQLSVQLRLGAFAGEDAASPAAISMRTRTSAITRYRPGGVAAPAAGTRSYDGTLPLEVLVEREPVVRLAGANLRTAANAGLRFLEFIREVGGANNALAKAYVDTYPMNAIVPAPDGETARLLQLLAGRVPDGHALYAAFRPQGTPPGQVVVPTVPDATGFPNVANAAKSWAAWYDELISAPQPGQDAWVRDRLEYAFATAAPDTSGETVLEAREYVGGRLDWDAFDLLTRNSLGAAGGPAPNTVTTSVLPAPVSFGGMPASRFFEMEDGTVNFGKIDTGPSDLGRMLLIEFACLYGNDHFIIPLELGIGSLCRIASLVIIDNFGGRTRIRPSEEVATADGVWQMYRLESDGGKVDPVLFLPPTLGQSPSASPIEEVLFTRDEMANMAWGIERLVESPSGRPIDRHEAYEEQRRRQQSAPALPNTESPLVYRLQTSVPPHWLPLLPVSAGYRQIRLRRGTMIDPVTGQPIPPLGLILGGAPPLELFEEEVPRSGARVRRAYRYGRWTDGSTHIWVARRKDPGRGESSSGLRFDALEPAEMPR